jgi:hypothetical protein
VVFTTPTMAAITTFMVEYGHLLIGLSLLTGLMVRVSASFGVVLMIIYWFAHMDWPFIESTNNFIVDYHLVYGGVLVYHRQARGARLRARRLGREFRTLQAAPQPQAAGCLTLRRKRAGARQLSRAFCNKTRKETCTR